MRTPRPIGTRQRIRLRVATCAVEQWVAAGEHLLRARCGINHVTS